MLPYVAIHQFGLRLHQIRDADAEVVRQGRNQPFVRERHFYEEIITPEQHRRWYEGICQTRDYYLVVSKDEIPLGLLYLRDITPHMHTGQLGIFFWDENFLRTRHPMLAIISFLDFFLMTVGIQNIEGIIRKENESMAHIMSFLGFDVFLNGEKSAQQTRSTRMQYAANHHRLIDFARRLKKDPASWDLRIEGEKDARHHPEMLRVIP